MTRHLPTLLAAALLAIPPLAAKDAAPVAKLDAPAAVESGKPSADEILAQLKAGNERYAADSLANPRCDASRRKVAVDEGQARHALVTVLSCADSRVPPEHIFDAGIMDLFVIRVAGNPAGADEIATIEYGLAHVKTPVLVVLGHSHCGAVTAAVGKTEPKKEEAHGGGHGLEPNIEALVQGLVPAAQRARKTFPEASGKDLLDAAIEENVWLSVENLLKNSEVARRLVTSGQVVLAPAVYDLPTGKVRWLREAKVYYYLGKLEKQ